MAQPVLYLYSTALPSSGSAAALLGAVEQFVQSRSWLCEPPHAVSQKSELGYQEVGLNLTLPAPHREPPAWFQDVQAILAFAVRARRQFGCNFIVGVAEGQLAEDIAEVESDSPDVEYVRQFLGVSPPSQVDGDA